MTDAPALTTAAPVRTVKAWDIVLTIALILIGSGLVAVLVILGALLGVAGDRCSEFSCSFTQIGLGILVAIAAPVVLFLIAIVVSIVMLVKKRRAFWVPLVGIVLAVIGWVIGFLMVSTAVDGFYG